MSAFVWSLLAALSWGCAPILEKMGLAKMDPMVGLFYRCAGVAIGTIPLLAWQWQGVKSSFSQGSHGLWLIVLGGFVASVVGQFFFYHALKAGEASRVVPLAACYPLISFILAIMIFGEKATLAKSAGLAFILLGIFLLK
jgi:bacterial/archaeal transporter family protein